MTRWIVTIGVAVLLLGEMFLCAPLAFAQTPGGSFDQLSPGNQKVARALFEAQPSRLPPGSRPLTLDEIAARKQTRGGGWGRVYDSMRSDGLVTTKNVGQAVSGYNQRHHVSAGPVTTRRMSASNSSLPTLSAPACKSSSRSCKRLADVSRAVWIRCGDCLARTPSTASTTVKTTSSITSRTRAVSTARTSARQPDWSAPSRHATASTGQLRWRR